MQIRRATLIATCAIAALAIANVAAASCPYAGAGYSDGCAAAPANGAFQQSNFGTYARQTGQQWVSSHPQPWTVAGWDYAVGSSQVAATGMYPLVRPDLATSGGAGAGTNLPYATAANGCVYSATGNPYMLGSPVVSCRGLLPNNGTGAYAGHPVISGVDFSADANGNCVQLYINLKNAQTVYVVNNNFKKNAGCTMSGNSNNAALITVVSSPISLVLKYNMFDGSAPFQTDQANTVYMGGTGTIDAEYNAFVNNIGRPLNGDSRSGWTLKYNYFDGMTIGATAPHGEMAGTFPNPDFTTIAYQDDEFNTAVWGAATSGIAGVNAAFFMSGGGNGQTLTTGTMANNTLVSNLEYNGTPSSGKVIMSLEIPYVTTLNMTQNYADASGSYLCMQVEGDEIGLAGYIDDGKGAGGAYDGVAGNVMHITARGGKDFILTGAQLFQGSGAGLPGNPIIAGGVGYVCNGVVMNGATDSIALQGSPNATYCLSGPPKAVASFSGVQTMPQVGTINVSGNVNLQDGTPITKGADLQWNKGTCNGKG